jgi:AAA15 family ATPase/GTPase
MKFSSINISGFRGIRKIEIDDFKRINLFVGKNNSGKTSVLEAIFLSIGVANPELILKIDLFRQLVHDKIEDFRYIFYNLSYESKLTIKSQLINSSEYRTLEIKPIYATQRINVGTGDIVSTDSGQNIEPKGLEFEISVKQNPYAKGIKVISKIIQDGKQIKIEIAKNYKESLLGRFYSYSQRYNGLYDRLNKIIVNKEEEDIINILQEIEPNIRRISLGTGKMIYFDIGASKLVPCNIMGDGIVNLISILTCFAETRNGCILIDEIDTGLHYSSLETLWKSMSIASEKYNVQVFATTHSLECVRTFSKTLNKPNSSKDDIRLYRIEKHNDTLKAIKFDKTALKVASEKDWEIR